MGALATGCAPVARLEVTAVPETEAPLAFGVLPTDEMSGLERRFGPMVAYVGRELGRKAVLVVSPEYESLGALVDQGKVDLGWFSGVTYQRWAKRHHLAPIAQSVLRGDSTYRGILVVRVDSPLRTVAELRGKRFAYVDRDSGSGFTAANGTLVKAGLDPLRDLGSIAFTHSHFLSAEGVVNGLYDAAALYEQAPQVFRDRLKVSELRILAKTEPVQKDVVACSERVPAAFKERLWKLFEALPRSEEGRRVVAVLEKYNPIDGFQRMK